MRQVKAAELVLDYNLYPRNNVDRHNVRAIKDAILAGANVPPVKIDRKSKRVIDGFHRVIAYLELDKTSSVDAIEQVYKDEAEMFLDAMRLNAAHGARLDPCDRTHCAIVSERLQIPLDQVAGALNMPVDKLARLKEHRTGTTHGGLEIPLKRTIGHMTGRRLTKLQCDVNERSSGMNQVFYANQLIDLIEAKLLDMDDEKLIERLRHLHELLESLLVVS